MDISYNNTIGKFQLKLPESVVNELQLTTQEGQSLEIYHENRMSLEWLYNDILQRHTEFSKLMDKGAKRRRKKLAITSILFLLSLLALLFNHQIATLTNNPVSIVNMFCIVFVVLSGWTAIQTYFLSGLSARESLMNNVKTVQLQEEILEKYTR